MNSWGTFDFSRLVTNKMRNSSMRNVILFVSLFGFLQISYLYSHSVTSEAYATQ